MSSRTALGLIPMKRGSWKEPERRSCWVALAQYSPEKPANPHQLRLGTRHANTLLRALLGLTDHEVAR
ncbi:hypothetical protein [Streptomyces sp. NPDC002666]